ncbi:putative fructokinase [Helianthus annuus]|nr:putative fructokinase [Helianthus annuus]
MEVAKDAGALLSYDPNLRLPLWPSPEEAREKIMSIWDKAEVIKVSDNELEFLTGSDKIDEEVAMSLWHPNLKLLLVTLGDKGCNYYTKVMYPLTHPQCLLCNFETSKQGQLRDGFFTSQEYVGILKKRKKNQEIIQQINLLKS